MPTVTDDFYSKLSVTYGTGKTATQLERLFYSATTSETTAEAKSRFFAAAGYTTGTINERELTYFRIVSGQPTASFSGAFSDYWADPAQGGGATNNGPFFITDFDAAIFEVT